MLPTKYPLQIPLFQTANQSPNIPFQYFSRSQTENWAHSRFSYQYSLFRFSHNYKPQCSLM